MYAVISENFIPPAALAALTIISEIGGFAEEAGIFQGAAASQDKGQVVGLRG